MSKIIYFEEYGEVNTNQTIELVKERIKQNDIQKIAVASTTGATGLLFAKEFQKLAQIVAISYVEMKSEYKEKIMELGAIALDKTHVPFDYDGTENQIRETYRTISQGFKVAVEVVLIGTDLGAINQGEKVIGVAGTEKGADTIIVAKATNTKDIFGKDEDKKLEIYEILAFPKVKFWW